MSTLIYYTNSLTNTKENLVFSPLGVLSLNNGLFITPVSVQNQICLPELIRDFDWNSSRDVQLLSQARESNRLEILQNQHVTGNDHRAFGMRRRRHAWRRHAWCDVQRDAMSNSEIKSSNLHWSFWGIIQLFSAHRIIFWLYFSISNTSSLSVVALTHLRPYTLVRA